MRCSSRRDHQHARPVLAVLLCAALHHLPATSGFVVPFSGRGAAGLSQPPLLLPRQNQQQQKRRTFKRFAQDVDTDKQKAEEQQQGENGLAKADTNASSQIWNWGSDSFGNMLIQMQKKEALLAANQTLEEQAVDLSAGNNNNTTGGGTGGTGTGYVAEQSSAAEQAAKHQDWTQNTPTRADQSQLVAMNWETAKELDDAVTKLTGDAASLRENVQVLPLPSLYREVLRARDNAAFATTAATTSPVEPDIPLSRPEHYRDRIGRDLCQLAVSIASSTENTAQWRAFCQENGGLFPLLETVREGARSIREENSKSTVSERVTLRLWDHQDDAFQAVRALRDLMAISAELSTVITDGILRANFAWQGGLLHDLCTMLQYANEYDIATSSGPQQNRFRRRNRRNGRLRCKLYCAQLLLGMSVASDDAVSAIRDTEGLATALLASSSYAPKEQRRRWMRYPGEMIRWIWRSKTEKNTDSIRRPFLEAANVANDLNGQVQRTTNQVLAAIGYNHWIPKSPGQKGLRILCLDGGGSRGMTAISIVNYLVENLGNGSEVADSFDIVAGTSTGAIIAFLVALRRETSAEAMDRYNALVRKVFVKGALSTPMMLFTTATYDESPFMDILSEILQDESMLDSRADPTVPFVFAVASKMSSTPTHVSLFRNYNYAGGEMPDPFTIKANAAREDTGLLLELENELLWSSNYSSSESSTSSIETNNGSRYPGSFRVLQRYALRASTAAPTVFKPVMVRSILDLW